MRIARKVFLILSMVMLQNAFAADFTQCTGVNQEGKKVDLVAEPAANALMINGEKYPLISSTKKNGDLILTTAPYSDPSGVTVKNVLVLAQDVIMLDQFDVETNEMRDSITLDCQFHVPAAVA